jgi:hypothetical protein
MRIAHRRCIPLFSLKFLAVGLLVLSGTGAFAQSNQFPADFVVNVDEALVFPSKPEPKHSKFVTNRLVRGERVRVVREDLGGWFVIVPPASDFSWISRDAVEKLPGNKGRVIAAGAVDWIGSTVEKDAPSIFHRINQGEIVEILGESTLLLKRGPTDMFKIRPPRAEYRWLNQRDVVRASEFQPNLTTSIEADRPATGTIGLDEPLNEPVDPFASPVQMPVRDSPSGAEPTEVTQTLEVSEPPLQPMELEPPQLTSRPDAGIRVESKSLPGSAAEGVATPEIRFESPVSSEVQISPAQRLELDRAWAEIEQTDNRFRQMLKLPAGQWDLNAVRSSYEGLRNRTGSGGFENLVEQRLSAVDRYRQIQAEYLEFEQIARQTDARDEEIRRQYSAQWQSVSTRNPPTTRVIPTTPSAGQSVQVSPQATSTLPQQTSVMPAPGVQRPVSPQRTPPTPKFDGAGIIQRIGANRPGGATHVLLAPDGRVLSYLQGAPGVNLDSFLGQAMGMQGPRGFRIDINADFMVVHRLMPVQLRQ